MARVRLVLAAALVLQLGVGLYRIDDLWLRGHNGFNGAAFYQGALNTLRFGVIYPAQHHTGLEPPPRAEQYSHHPLGMHLSHVSSLAVFGNQRWALRIVPALMMWATALALFLATRRLFDVDRALLALVLFVVTPVNTIYAAMPNHMPGMMAFGIVAVLCHLARGRALQRGETEPARRWAVGLFVSISIAAVWDWPTAYLALAIAVHWAFACRGGRRSDPRLLVGFCAWVLLLLGGQLLVAALAGAGADELLATVSRRTSTASWSSYASHLWHVVPLVLGRGPLMLILIWLVLFARRAWRGAGRDRDLLVVSFLLVGGLHHVLFRGSAVAHSYWSLPLLPSVVVASADLLYEAVEWVESEGGRDRVVRALPWVFVGAHAFWAIPVGVSGRQVNGSLWFAFPNVRGAHRWPYESDRTVLTIAAWCEGQIATTVPVLLDESLGKHERTPRLATTFGRPRREVRGLPDDPTEPALWLGRRDALSQSQLRDVASHQRVVVFNDYLVVFFGQAPGIEHRQLVEANDGPLSRLLTSGEEPRLVVETRPRAVIDRSDGAIPELDVVRGKPSAIDGEGDDSIWKHAASTGAFVHPTDGKARDGSVVNAEAKLAWDADALYLLFTVRDVEPSTPFGRDDVDPHIWSKASGVELMLQPGLRQDNRSYYEVQVDVGGAVWDTRFDDYNQPVTGHEGNRRFGHQQWSARLERVVARQAEGYTVEMALPWAALEGVAPPVAGQRWKANLYSFKNGQRDALSWSPILGEGNFHRSSRFGLLRFE